MSCLLESKTVYGLIHESSAFRAFAGSFPC